MHFHFSLAPKFIHRHAELWTVNGRYWYLLVSSVITAWSSVILRSFKFILHVTINILKGILTGLIIIDCFKNSNVYIFLQFLCEMIINIHFTTGRIKHRKKHEYVCVCTCVCMFKTDLGNFSLTFPKNYFTDYTITSQQPFQRHCDAALN